jgi:hypothetical protein
MNDLVPDIGGGPEKAKAGNGFAMIFLTLLVFGRFILLQ